MKTEDHKANPKLSVVVITYNNELYIEDALASLHTQTFQDMEIVVVNDNSSDNTAKLIEEYIMDKPKFRAIHLETNSGGCSVPRNTGIANSTGQYLMFLDGDDWYTPNACEKMVEAIERTGSDFVSGQAIRTNNYEIWYHNQIFSKERTNINVREFPMLLFDSISPNKIYQRSFLDKNNLRFPEGIHYEDIYFTGKAYFLANSISVIPYPIYYWRVVEDAENKSITNQRDEFQNFADRINAHRLFDQFLTQNGDSIYQANKNNKFLRHDLKLYLNDYPSFTERYQEQFFKLANEYLNEVMNKYEFLKLGQNERICYFLIFTNNKLVFDDYIRYTTGQVTKTDRVVLQDGNYYFSPDSVEEVDIKFLLMNEIIVENKISNLTLTEQSFSFDYNIDVKSVSQEEYQINWLLVNKHTGHLLKASHDLSGRAQFNISVMEAGDYSLRLTVSHYGKVLNQLVKKTSILDFRNLSVKDGDLIKRFYITNKNSFVLKARPATTFSNVVWSVNSKIRPKHKQAKVSGYKLGLERVLKNIIRKLPVKRNMVIFESHMGKQYSDSPKYIYEEMLNQQKDFKYIWSFEDSPDAEVAGKPIIVKRNSLKHYYYLSRSKYWVDNQGIGHLFPKKKQQIYIQTWHGIPLKKMGLDQERKIGLNERKRLKQQVENWDYFISPNRYSTEIFRRAFRVQGEVLETGYPRNDVLANKPVNPSLITKIEKRVGIKPNSRTILYAPTFRDWKTESVDTIMKRVLEISRKLGEHDVLILRLHYLLSNLISGYELPSNVIEASNYPDAQELYLVSDILITDYSSTMFDYAILNRPVILYCYDYDEYKSKRGIYFDLESKGPGPVCRDLSSVLTYLNDSERLYAVAEKKLVGFNARFGYLEDGLASERVIEQVFK